MLKSVGRARVLRAQRSEPGANSAQRNTTQIVINTRRQGFRATLVEAQADTTTLALNDATLKALGIQAGDPVRTAELDVAARGEHA